MKRSVWLAVGFGLGVYVGEQARRAVVKATPDAVAERVRGAWSDALAAGRTEMRTRERRLRETFAAPDPDRDLDRSPDRSPDRGPTNAREPGRPER